MKILVGVKRVIDYNVRVQINREGTGVITEGVKMSINPFDEIAVEQALQLREAGAAEEVIAVSIGPGTAQQQLRTALAMGADRAILVETDEEVQPLAAARVFKSLIDKEEPGLVLLGKQAIDDDANQTGQMLAAIWDKPQATFMSALELADGKAKAVREVDAVLRMIHQVLVEELWIAVRECPLVVGAARQIKRTGPVVAASRCPQRVFRVVREELESLILRRVVVDTEPVVRVVVANEGRQRRV